MATYAEIQAEVLENVIDAPPVVTNSVGRLVNRAMREAQRKYNFQVMRATWEVETGAGLRVLGTLPANWKAARGAPYYQTETGRAIPMTTAPSRKSADEMWGIDPDLHLGEPAALLEADKLPSGSGVMWVYPFPDGNSDWSNGEYRIKVPYWRWLDPLTLPSHANWLTNEGEEWIIFQATAMAFGKDWNEDRGIYWQQQAALKWKELLRADKIAVLSGVDVVGYTTGARAPQITLS